MVHKKENEKENKYYEHRPVENILTRKKEQSEQTKQSGVLRVDTAAWNKDSVKDLPADVSCRSDAS